MTNPVKLASALPAEYRNGLVDIVRQLVESPASQRIALVVFDVKRVEEDVDAEAKVPTVRLLRVELPLELDRQAAWEMLQRATDARVDVERAENGEQPLPFDLRTATGYEG